MTKATDVSYLIRHQVMLFSLESAAERHLAMTGRRAVGRRVRVFWELDDAFFSGTLAAFDARAYAYRIEYDDGDVETSFEPWREVVSLVKCRQSDRARLKLRPKRSESANV